MGQIKTIEMRQFHPLSNYVHLYTFTRMRKNGKIVYKVSALAQDGSTPDAGKIQIGYNPYRLNIILPGELSKN